MLLNENIIRQHLTTHGFASRVTLHVLDSVDSTSRFLKAMPASPTISLCCAETQTQGRGRFDRPWYSPHGENIYCSIRWPLPSNTRALSTLSLVMSLAVLRTLQTLQINQGIAIKWPNDLMWQDKKLCGILLESTQPTKDILQIVVGIGLNVNSVAQQHQNHAAPSQPWCSLYDITKKSLNRNILIAQLLIHTDAYVSQFITGGFVPFFPLWQTQDYLYQKKITLVSANQTVQGTAQGITHNGELILIDHTDRIHHFSCGEAAILRGLD